ncbi:MAG: hypothetical protein JXB13_15295 [Phycisphaerae bacterium]|nr:hypothetical protein [Phycisphaerae bacterium]
MTEENESESVGDRGEFHDLYRELKEFRDDIRVEVSSRPEDHNDCEAFRRIVAGGERFLPFIVEEIRRGDFYLNQAMHEITGIDVRKHYNDQAGLGGEQHDSELWIRWWNGQSSSRRSADARND